MEFISKISSGFSSSKELIEEVFSSISRIISGIISILIFYLIYEDFNFSLIIELRNYINAFSYLDFAFLFIFSYVIGSLAVTIFDYFFSVIPGILILLMKICTSRKWSKLRRFFKVLFYYFVVKTPLTKDFDNLSAEYKTLAIDQLSEVFGNGLTEFDLVRLSRNLVETKGLIKVNRTQHFFDLYKGMYINISFLTIFFLSHKMFIEGTATFILGVAILEHLKERTLRLRIAYVDYAFLLVKKLLKTDPAI